MKSLILLQNVDFPHDAERQGEGCGAAEVSVEVPRTREGSQESRRDAGRRGGHRQVI